MPAGRATRGTGDLEASQRTAAGREALRARVMLSDDPLQLNTRQTDAWVSPQEEDSDLAGDLPGLARRVGPSFWFAHALVALLLDLKELLNLLIWYHSITFMI